MRAFLFSFFILMMANCSLFASASIYDIPLTDIDGNDTTLKPYAGKVILIVNVASKCRFTPQYGALEATYNKYQDQGFVVCGFPCNQFGKQEPDTDAEVKRFIVSRYHVTFPMFEKINVNGRFRHPLYVALAGKDSPFPGNIQWNFTKFLIGRDGKIVARFDSEVKPDSPEVTQAIETALAAK
jgi:glutathione peroxidase